jgi:hypothetical protein
MRAGKPRLIIFIAMGVAIAETATARAGSWAGPRRTHADADRSPEAPGRVLLTSIPTDALAPATPDSPHSRSPALDALPAGSRICLLDPSRADHRTVNLTPDFAAAGRPSLSFTADRLLFVARESSTGDFQIWEMSLDGTDSRQITTAPSPVTARSRATYLSTLYSMDQDQPLDYIAFTGRSRTGHDGRDAIFICRPDGSDLRQITFSPCPVRDPVLLTDGRLLVGGGPNDAGTPTAACGPPALMAVYPDGTDLFLFTHVRAGHVAAGACEMPSEQVVFVEGRFDARHSGGALVAVSRLRPLHSRRQLTGPDEGTYLTPSAVNDSTLLVSYRRFDDPTFGLYLFDVPTATRTRTVLDVPNEHALDGVVVQPRPRPAGRSSVVRSRESYGSLYGLDAYLSQDVEAGPKVQIRRINVYGAVDEETGAATRGRLIGEIPVEPDGSWFAEVPARMPLRLETVGPDGQTLRRMESWFWVMPREARGCIGCHEDRELTPPNRFPLALRKPPARIEFAPAEDEATPKVEAAP